MLTVIPETFTKRISQSYLSLIKIITFQGIFTLVDLTFPRKSTKSPTVLMVATLRTFSTRITSASFAEVQKFVLLMAVAV